MCVCVTCWAKNCVCVCVRVWYIYIYIYIEGESAKLKKLSVPWLMASAFIQYSVHIQLTLQELITGISLLKEYNYCPTERRDQNKNRLIFFVLKLLVGFMLNLESTFYKWWLMGYDLQYTTLPSVTACLVSSVELCDTCIGCSMKGTCFLNASQSQCGILEKLKPVWIHC